MRNKTFSFLFLLFTPMVLLAQSNKTKTSVTANNHVAGTVQDTPNTVCNYELFHQTMDGIDTLANGYTKRQVGTPYGLTIVTKDSRKCARFELRDTDPEISNGTRSEIVFPALTSFERWYSWDVYFPSDEYGFDDAPEIITQWHQGHKESPSISLQTKADKMLIDVRSQPGVSNKYPLSDLVKDKWQHFYVHIIHSNDFNGLIEIWKDGAKIFTLNGPNSYDFAGFDLSRWKLGLYKWKWNDDKTTLATRRVIYFDNIRLCE
jgi:hypothetical protein